MVGNHIGDKEASNNIIEMEDGGRLHIFEGEQTFYTADGSPAMLFTNTFLIMMMYSGLRDMAIMKGTYSQY